jgi:molecular chaperone GrpE (heat shock protein)
VKPIDALGADFDPNVHQAVVHEASPSIAKAK